jgi:hypothetical protein
MPVKAALVQEVEILKRLVGACMGSESATPGCETANRGHVSACRGRKSTCSGRLIKWNVFADKSLLPAEWQESRAGSLVPYLLYDA